MSKSASRADSPMRFPRAEGTLARLWVNGRRLQLVSPVGLTRGGAGQPNNGQAFYWSHSGLHHVYFEVATQTEGRAVRAFALSFYLSRRSGRGLKLRYRAELGSFISPDLVVSPLTWPRPSGAGRLVVDQRSPRSPITMWSRDRAIELRLELREAHQR